MHILQRVAKTTKANGNGLPPKAEYDIVAGVWRSQEGLVAFDPENEMTTKKNDLETGEDQKGE
ncbi:hypothetical protein [Rhizobium sp. A37_96]